MTTTLISILAGLAIAAIAYFSGRFSTFPAIRAVKEAYPIINVALLTIAEITNGTPYDYLFDVAAAVWAGPGISNEQAARLTHAAVEYFKKSKYNTTNFRDLDPSILAKGQQIGREILSRYDAKLPSQ